MNGSVFIDNNPWSSARDGDGHDENSYAHIR